GEEGRERDDRRGGIAPRVADEPRLTDRLGPELGQAVGGAARPLWGCVLLLIPLRVDGGVREPEIGGEIDYLAAGVEQMRGRLHRLAVLHCQEDDVALRQLRAVPGG